MRYRVKLTNYTNGEKNRFQNSLTISNVQLDHAFSDVFGKSATAILNQLLEYPDNKDFDVTPFVHKSCKTSIEEIQLSIDGTISTVIFFILKNSESYNPELYRKYDTTPIVREQQAIALLEKRGFIITKSTA